MKLVLLLALLSVSECSSQSVVGLEGHNVTLECRYKYHTALSACWGRGKLPYSGCSDQLISTNGQVVDAAVSSRYQLLGRLDEGDVSLTILNVTRSDAGWYGCLVKIPGLFNNQKHNINLVIDRAAQTTVAAAVAPADTSAAGQVTSAVTLLTSSSSSIQAEDEEDGAEIPVLVCVLFGLVALVTAGGLIIIILSSSR